MSDINKITCGVSTTSQLFNTVNELVDNTNKTVIDGDTRTYTEADLALSVDGQVKMVRDEKNVNETHRPVWFAMDYKFSPPTSPVTDVDYHGVDIFGDVGLSSYDIDLSKAQLYLTESKAFYSGTETLLGNYGAFFEATNNSTGTVRRNVAVRIWSRNRAGGHIENQYGILMTSPDTGVGTVDNSYGIYLNDISSATNSYAIYTNAGDVRFGGDTHIDAHLSSSGNITQSVNLDDINVTTSQSGSNLVGAPTASYYYVKTTVHDNLYAEQWLTGLTGSVKDKIFRRVKDNGTWQPWREIATSPVP